MKRTAVLNVVGLTRLLIGADTPNIARFLGQGAGVAINPTFPAVTCSAQSTYLTGLPPAQHGIVGNGWYDRDLAEVHFWKQSNHLVSGRKIWEELRELEPDFTCAKLFWWHNMYSTADWSITPRPIYPADGRKIFDIHTWPYSIRQEIKGELGEFPFPTFWGPATGVNSPQGAPDAASRWIAASAKWIERKYAPSLSLIYLPHLDYNLQRLGPKDPSVAEDLRRIDAIVGGLIDFFRERKVQVILLSEYGVTSVDTPIYVNRVLRQYQWLEVKEELGREMLDCGASRAFAVADHQIAHVYLNDPAISHKVRLALEGEPGVERVLDRKEQSKLGIDHPRAGDLIAIARPNAWFAYYYWLDDRVAPDFARCVDIHRKPGYDPLELFLDPELRAPKLKIAWRLLQKKLGLRMLMDVIPLSAGLVKGSHGRPVAADGDCPMVISERADLIPPGRIEAKDVYHVLKRHLR